MRRISTILAPLILPLALIGCFPSPDYRDLPDARVIGHSTEIVNTLTIADLRAPTEGEMAELFSQLAQTGEAGVRIRVQLARAVAQASELEIRRMLADLGIPPGIAVLERRSGVEQTRLLIEKTTLTMPDCDRMITPSESYDFLGFTYASRRPTMAFGCATYSNLGQLLADPADLAEPHALGEPDAAVNAGAIQRYQDNAVTPLRKTTATKKNSGQ